MSVQPAADMAADGQVEVITLMVKDVEFCLDIGAVREIRGWTPATPIPHAPEFAIGVINLRGTVMPVLDLAARLGLGMTEPTSRHVILVAQCGDQVAGLLVDSVQEALSVSLSQLQPPPPVCEQERMGIIDAILALEGRMISRIVVDRLVQSQVLLAA